MGCISTLGKYILIILNIAFMIIALGIIIVGVILRFIPGTLVKFIFDAVKAIDQFKVPESAESLQSVPVLQTLGLIILIIGLFLFSISFLACYGAYCESRILLLVYVIILIPLILVLLIMGCLILIPDSVLHRTLRDQLVQRVKKEYKGPLAEDPFSLAINILSFSLKCCAASGPDDFKLQTNAPWKNYTYKGNTFNIDISPACCKQEVLKNDLTFACAKSTPDGYNSTITNTQGCYNKLQDLLQENIAYAGLTLAVMIALLVVLVIFAILVMKNASIVPLV